METGVGTERIRLEQVSGEGVTWTNIEKPSRKEMELLGQIYPFHHLDLDDCLSRTQLPKIDEYEDYLFIILHFPRYDKRARLTHASQVSIFLGRNYLTTVHSGDLKPLSNLFQGCQENESRRQELLGRDSGYLLYRLIDALVDYLFPMMEKVLSNLEAIEDAVFDEKVDAGREVAIQRRDIAAQRRIITPLKSVLSLLEHKAQRFTKEDLRAYFGDITDHISRIWETLEECKETVEIYKDSDFVLSADRSNRILTALTIILAIMLPFTVISGIYGMNIPLPGGMERGSPLSFILLLSFMALLTGGLLLAFRRRGWL